MWSARLGCVLLAVLAGATPALAQDSARWERGEEGAVTFADLAIDRYGRFTAFCRTTSTGALGGLVLTSPRFQTQVINEQSYSLTLVIDGARDSVHMEARDIELWFEAKDLNQQNQLRRLFDSLLKAQRIDFAVSTLGWRESRRIENSAELAGLMDKCI
jgi:hypothetical protein